MNVHSYRQVDVYVSIHKVAEQEPVMKPDTGTFLKVLEPKDTSTGGGSASAIAGSMGAALVAMVCLLSPETQADLHDVSISVTGIGAQELSHQLLAGSKADTDAFQAVREAHKLPKASGEERRIRNKAVQDAWLEATEIPLENAARCVQVVKVGTSLLGRINPKAGSDLNCAIWLGQAGALGCLENVYVNLSSIQDRNRATALAQQASRLREELSAVIAVMGNRNSVRSFPM
jgi:formiminotetrahydrofolate cyclodeaminase